MHPRFWLQIVISYFHPACGCKQLSANPTSPSYRTDISYFHGIAFQLVMIIHAGLVWLYLVEIMRPPFSSGWLVRTAEVGEVYNARPVAVHTADRRDIPPAPSVQKSVKIERGNVATYFARTTFIPYRNYRFRTT